MPLEDSIKKWVKLDNEYNNLNSKLRDIREERNNLSSEIINFFEDKNINNPTINITGGKINLVNQKTANALSYKFIENCLKEYFDNDEKMAIEVFEFIKSKRNYVNTKNLKRIDLVKE
jgi:hypothetical protein